MRLSSNTQNMFTNFTWLLAAVMMTIVHVPGAAAQQSSQAVDFNRLMALVNSARASQQLQPVRYDSRLECAAKRQCSDMLATGIFDHNVGRGVVGDRAKACGFDYALVSENLLRSLTSVSNTDRSFKGWMGSEGHRHNIMKGEVDKTGIAVCQGQGRLWWVQVFGRERGSSSEQSRMAADTRPLNALRTNLNPTQSSIPTRSAQTAGSIQKSPYVFRGRDGRLYTTSREYYNMVQQRVAAANQQRTQ